MALSRKLAIELKKKLSDSSSTSEESVLGESPLSVIQFKRLFECYLYFNELRLVHTASETECFCGVTRVIMHQIVENWYKSNRNQEIGHLKRICYFSLEYNMGRSLNNHIMNLNVRGSCNKTFKALNLNFNQIENEEEVADLEIGEDEFHSVCILDSLATLKIPAYCYGVRFNYNIFTQKIIDGHQFEEMHNKKFYPNPWERKRPEYTYPVQFYGQVVNSGNNSRLWENAKVIQTTAYDVPITGFKNKEVNTLRLWSAKYFQNYKNQFSNTEEYIQTLCDINKAKNITTILCPNDINEQETLLKQEYLMVSASLQDMLYYFNCVYVAKENLKIKHFPEKIAIHLNDTHPSLIIPEFMRYLLDKEKMAWDDAWNIITKTCSFTCHNTDSMTLERWPLDIFGKLLPRHLEIIREINERFLLKVKLKWPKNHEKLIRMSLIEEGIGKVNMAYLTIVACHKICTVSNMHVLLLKHNLFKDFYELWPEKFINITSGVSPRQWLLACSPSLAEVISQYLQSTKWVFELHNLNGLAPFIKNERFQNDIIRAKHKNKIKLISHLKSKYTIDINPDSIINVQTSTFVSKHKRYLLKCLHIVVLYNRIVRNPYGPFVPRTILIGGKATPICSFSKRVINFIHALAKTINNNPQVGNKLKIIFLENYNTSYAKQIIPAADLNETLSLAGTQMFGANYVISMLNGTLNIGTLNGVYLEIKAEIGSQNTFIFGMSQSQLLELKRKGYNAMEYYNTLMELKDAVNVIENETFENENFKDLAKYLMNDDEYFTFADFESYIQEQGKIDSIFMNKEAWSEKMIVNIVASGKFSSDRTVAEYAEKVWGL